MNNGDCSTQTPLEQTRTAIEQTVREEWGRVLATLVGYVRDFDIAEDILQDALVGALQHWPEQGITKKPGNWLLQTARRKAIDRFRRDANFTAKRTQLEVLIRLENQVLQNKENDMDGTLSDERLRLIFTCCHPALAEQVRVALTLRTLGGLTTAEISRAFLVPEITMAQRLVRAKSKIKAANIPYRVPPPHLWLERLNSVLTVIYLIFNEGYAATSGGKLTRADLCHEAIRLGRILVCQLPQEAETTGLLALMLLSDSRRSARIDNTGNLVTLEQQDRHRWNREQIEEGVNLLKQALAFASPGPYQIQAAISAVHSQSESYDATDWNEIMLLYGELYELQPSPVVKLNAAVALSFAKGADAGLAALAELEKQQVLEQYQPFHAARADFLRRSGRREEAAAAFRRALELTQNSAEKRFLKQRLLAVLE